MVTHCGFVASPIAIARDREHRAEGNEGKAQHAPPEFDVEAVASIGDPTVGCIRAKCQKSYDTPYPIELLAYYELQPQAPATFWRPRLESFVTGNSSDGLFRRIWVYDIGAKAIAYESGMLASTGRL